MRLAKFLPSKETRKIYVRKIKGFWEDYSRNKIGLAGMAILIFFVLIAVLAPWLTPYDPVETKYLAEAIAMPEWVTMFPQYRNLPPTTEILAHWQVKQGSDFVDVELGNETIVQYNGGGTGKTDIYLQSSFDYKYHVPKDLKLTFKYEFGWNTPVCEQTGYSLEFILVTWDGREYSLGDSYYGYKEKLKPEIPLLTEETNSTLRVKATSWNDKLWLRVGWSTAAVTFEYPSLAHKVFNAKGEYYLQMHIVIEPTSENATCEINLEDAKITIPGLIHGLLGTDHFGGDLFSQLVYSTRTSLIIGLLTGLCTTVIGLIVGVVAGYVGGTLDELLMRITDVFLCIPLLPVVITLTLFLGANIYLLIILLSVLWWTGLARVVRSRVLSLREMAFVESARAVGAGKFYIIFRHMVPNVLPLAFAAMVLNVPSAIIAEASISFIGLTPLLVPTWGKMLHRAFYAGAFQRFAWWWIIPPGLALMVLSLAFVFIGHAVDEIVNPRLRRRR